MQGSKFKIHHQRARDPRELPAYSIREAAHYLLQPTATLKSWVHGRYYPVAGGKKFFKPVIGLPDGSPPQLSFVNLIEAHVLSAIRREHKVPLPQVRHALDYLAKNFPSEHPLADNRFETDGLSLFVEKYGQLINVSQEGQLAMRRVLELYLKRIERDPQGVAIRLYPFTRMVEADHTRLIVIDPMVSFGRPVVADTGIPTAVIAERYKAGESIDELGADYGLEKSRVEEAIRCELRLEAA